MNLLEDLQDRLGLTYVFIAHDLSVVRHFAQRVGVMFLGRMVEAGPAEALFTNPRHPYTRFLMAAVPGARPPPAGPGEAAAAGGDPQPHRPAYRVPVPHALSVRASERCAREVPPGTVDGERTWACHFPLA